MNLVNYGLRERYEQLKKRGDKLAEIKNVIDRESLSLYSMVFLQTTPSREGGRTTTRY